MVYANSVDKQSLLMPNLSKSNINDSFGLNLCYLKYSSLMTKFFRQFLLLKKSVIAKIRETFL